MSAVARQYPSNVEYKIWPLLNDLHSHARAVENQISAKACQIHRATILHTLSHYHLEQGVDSSALDLLLECRTLRHEHLRLEHENTPSNMGLLGVAYNKLDNWKDAQHIQLQVLEIAKRVLTPSHRITMKGISRLALTHMKQGQVRPGQKLQMHVLELIKRDLGPENPDEFRVHLSRPQAMEKGRSN